MTSKSKFVLLDADVVIHLHELHAWNDFCEKYEVYLGETVVGESVFFYDPSQNQKRVYIDWDSYESVEMFHGISLDAKDLDAMIETLSQLNAPEIDPGEQETLAIIYNGVVPDLFMCSGDKAGLTSAVYLDLRDKCVSLESALKNCGLTKEVERQFSEAELQITLRKASIQKIESIPYNCS